MNKWIRRVLVSTLALASGCVTTSYTRGWISHSNQTTTQNGVIHGTRSLPPFGTGYRTYSLFGSALGRQYGHHKVIETLEESFANLHEQTGQTFDISEIGHRHGGRFLPHKTHRTGLSVDIVTPMKTGEGEPARLKTGPLSLWGYCWHINPKDNKLNGYKWDVLPGSTYPTLCPTVPTPSNKEVDFETLKLMIRELSSSAKSKGGRVKYVIVAPSFVSSLKGVGVPITTKANIVHDDHIHVEFQFD